MEAVEQIHLCTKKLAEEVYRMAHQYETVDDKPRGLNNEEPATRGSSDTA